MVQCPNCHHVFRTEDQVRHFEAVATEQQARIVDEHGPNAGDLDEQANG